MMAQVVQVTLSYLFMAVACLSYALTVQVIYELSTAQWRWRTGAALAAATLLATALHYLKRLQPAPEDEINVERGWPNWWKRKRTLRFKVSATAASIVVGLAAVFLAQHYVKFERQVATEASEWQHQTLPDGTVMHLDAHTRVKVEYTREARIVYAYQGGTVFEVAKDPTRPFIARTRLADITAVGTRFGVSINADADVTTTVSEGTVKVTARGLDSIGVMVSAGEEFRVGGSPLTSATVTRVDADRKLRWAATGDLILDGLTVAEGVEEFNRRNRVQIIVESPSLAAKVVPYAIVPVNSPETYAGVVAESAGVKLIRDDAKGVIRLTE